jgi:hypothetical protein
VSLRELAALDHAAILGDTSQGFAIPLVITSPAGVQIALAGFASDVGEIVDPESGLQVTGRRATVSFVQDPITQAGLGAVTAVAEENRRPWLVSFADAHGIVRTYKVIEVLPENDLGSLRCALEGYRAGPW